MNKPKRVRGQAIPRFLPVALGAAVCCAAGGGIHAQVAYYYADIKTVSTRVSSVSDSPLAQRLFLDQGLSKPAPLGTAIWFVADVLGNGIPAEAAAGTQVNLSQLLGADDYLLFADALDGDQPGNQAGQYRRVGAAIGLPPGVSSTDIEQARIYVFLWSVLATESPPREGDTFGILDLGVVTRPTIGNPFWAIDRNIAADTYQVIPEPAGLVGATALMLLAAGLGQRRTRSSPRA